MTFRAPFIALIATLALGGGEVLPVAASAAIRPQHGAHHTSSAGYCHTGGAALWHNLAACGWPGPGNTGPKLSQCPGHRLAPRGGHLGQAIVIRKAGTV